MLHRGAFFEMFAHLLQLGSCQNPPFLFPVVHLPFQLDALSILHGPLMGLLHTILSGNFSVRCQVLGFQLFFPSLVSFAHLVACCSHGGVVATTCPLPHLGLQSVAQLVAIPEPVCSHMFQSSSLSSLKCHNLAGHLWPELVAHHNSSSSPFDLHPFHVSLFPCLQCAAPASHFFSFVGCVPALTILGLFGFLLLLSSADDTGWPQRWHALPMATSLCHASLTPGFDSACCRDVGSLVRCSRRKPTDPNPASIVFKVKG